ncbi:hypothetical protein HK097_010426 [Rhizophlyctis rosea]|uniref:Uncharacterized protein n=1 Tax=Rhizophlyctis rosea TaxID=64517 RepID=A0AAD5X2J7_9FUNG|nr:hypothetical protein HK097_010426 [Rhizophlyctis rosea]
MKVATILAVLVSSLVAVNAQCQNPTLCGARARACRNAGAGTSYCLAACAATKYTCYGATLTCGYSQCRI